MRAPFKPFFLGILFTSILWAATIYYFFYYDSANLLPKQLPLNQSYHSIKSEVSKPTQTVGSVTNNSKVKNDMKNFGEDDLGLVRSKEDQKIREDGYAHHAFNVLVSSRLDYHRSIPDSRHKL